MKKIKLETRCKRMLADVFTPVGIYLRVRDRFRDTILGQGGSREAMDIFRAFRGREPSIEPLLRQDGLVEPASG